MPFVWRMHQSARCSLVIRIQHTLLIKEPPPFASKSLIQILSLSPYPRLCEFVCAKVWCGRIDKKARGSSLHGLWIFRFAVSRCKKFKYSVCMRWRVTLWSARPNGGLAATFPSLFALFRSQIRHPSIHPSFHSAAQMPQCNVRTYKHTHPLASYQQNCYYTFRFWGPGAVLWLYLKHISFALCRRRRLLLKQKSYQCARARASYNNIWKRETEHESLLWDKCWFCSCRKVKITQQHAASSLFCWQIAMTTFFRKNMRLLV